MTRDLRTERERAYDMFEALDERLSEAIAEQHEAQIPAITQQRDTAARASEAADVRLEVAQQLHRDLGIDESDGRCMMHRVDGQTRRGCRVVVTRCSDGVTMTRFVSD